MKKMHIGVSLTIAAVVGTTFGILAATETHGSTGATSPTASASPSAVYLSQPPTVQQISATLKATNTVECGSAPLGGVTDMATAYLNGKRIGIDTFPSATVRDNWKTTSATFGISSFAEGPTWVAYIATDQASKGCN
jgi:hypothetical protein